MQGNSIDPSICRSDLRPAIFAAALAVALYAVTLAGGFAYDFYGMSRADAHLRHPSQWGTYWTTSYNGGVDNLYRPLTSTLLATESFIFGLDTGDVWKFHLVSCLLNAACCALVAEFARRLAGARVAIIAGLLYAAHPIHVEVVCDIVGQAEMLCAIGMIGACLLMLRRPMTRARAVAIFSCFVLALLSKEQGMLLPLMLLLLVMCLRWPRVTPSSDRDAMRLVTLLLSWSLAAYIVIRERIVKFEWDRNFLDPAINPILMSHDKDRLLMPIVLIGHYLQLLVLPYKLAPDYSGTAIGWIARPTDPYLYLGVIAIVLWCEMMFIAFQRRAGVMLFCLVSLAMFYGLIGNIVTIIGTNFAERLMYLPSVFFLILCAIGLSQLPRRWMIGVTAILVLLGSVRTVTYAHRWNDRMTLYAQALRDQPGAVRMAMMLSVEQADRGDLGAALATVQSAQQDMPNYVQLWDFSAAMAIRAGDLDLAERYLNRAKALGPTLQTANIESKLGGARARASATTHPTTQQK